MKKQTLKSRLLDRIRKEGKEEGVTYKEIVTHILKLKNGEDYQVDWKSNDRGYFSDALRKGSGIQRYMQWPSFTSVMGGYLVNGGGTEGFVKTYNKKYVVRTFTKRERLEYQRRKLATQIMFTQNANEVRDIVNRYERTLQRIDKQFEQSK